MCIPTTSWSNKKSPVNMIQQSTHTHTTFPATFSFPLQPTLPRPVSQPTPSQLFAWGLNQVPSTVGHSSPIHTMKIRFSTEAHLKQAVSSCSLRVDVLKPVACSRPASPFLWSSKRRKTHPRRNEMLLNTSDFSSQPVLHVSTHNNNDYSTARI